MMRTLIRIILAILLLSWCAGTIAAGGPRELVEQACQRYILQQLGWNPDDLEITFHTYIEPELDWTGVVLQVGHPRNADLCGVATLKVAAVKDGDTLRSFPVPVEITLYDDVVVTVRRLRRGDVVSPSDVIIKRQRINLGADMPFADLADVVGRRATLALPAGRAITGAAIEDLPVVKRGDRVTLRYERKTLLLTAQGEAIEDGWPGRPVRVKNLSSKKTITGVAREVGVVDIAMAAAGD